MCRYTAYCEGLKELVVASYLGVTKCFWLHPLAFAVPTLNFYVQPNLKWRTRMNKHELWIDGRSRKTQDWIPVLDPSEGRQVGTIARGTPEDIDLAVTAARAAFAGPWGSLPPADRGRLLLRLGELLRRDFEKFASIESLDVGKPLSQARADAVATARYFEFYGAACDKVHGDTIPLNGNMTAYTVWEPHGVTAHIVPWNYPLQMLGRSVAPSLAMGNCTVVKPAEDTSLSALALAALTEEAGFPRGVYNVVTGLGEEVGTALSAHPDIGHISFTGSPEIGMLVQQAAARNAVPVTLELGGKSPQIVFADANLDAAATSVVRSIIQNAGQTCSAGSRVLIEDSIYEQFSKELAKRFAVLKVGSAARDLDLGPVISNNQLARIQGYLDIAKKDGIITLAEGLLSDENPPNGFYVKPTLLGNVCPHHRVAQEEIFGPVLAAIRFKDESDAIAIANGTPYGLVAGVWTSNIGRAMRLAKKVQSGQVFINDYGAGGGVELPFGGVKLSGHGREKGLAALSGFASLKTIVINDAHSA